jgi:hypothetical protein
MTAPPTLEQVVELLLTLYRDLHRRENVLRPYLAR